MCHGTRVRFPPPPFQRACDLVASPFFLVPAAVPFLIGIHPPTRPSRPTAGGAESRRPGRPNTSLPARPLPRERDRFEHPSAARGKYTPTPTPRPRKRSRTRTILAGRWYFPEEC